MFLRNLSNNTRKHALQNYDFLSLNHYLSRKTTKKKIEATRKHALQIGKQLPPGAKLIVI